MRGRNQGYALQILVMPFCVIWKLRFVSFSTMKIKVSSIFSRSPFSLVCSVFRQVLVKHLGGKG